MAAFGSGTNKGLSGTFDCGQPVSRVSAKSTGNAVKKCFMACSRKNHQVPQRQAVQGARLRAVGTWHEDTPVLASREAGCSPGACQEGAREPVKAVLHRAQLLPALAAVPCAGPLRRSSSSQPIGTDTPSPGPHGPGTAADFLFACIRSSMGRADSRVPQFGGPVASAAGTWLAMK